METYGVFNIFETPAPFEPNKLEEYIQQMTTHTKTLEQQHEIIQSPTFELLVSNDPANHEVDVRSKPTDNAPKLLDNTSEKPKQTNSDKNNDHIQLPAVQPVVSNLGALLPGSKQVQTTRKRKIDDDNWYGEIESTVKNYFDGILTSIKDGNQKSLSEISALKNQLKKLKTENENLKTTIEKLNEEKTGHVCKTKCKDCGQPINGLAFCSNDCIENNIKKRLDEN